MSAKDKGLHIAIVGTGSAAFAAAIKAVEEGARITLIEGGEVIGGTCVNTGCVPSKIFIRGAHIAHLQGHHVVAGIPPNIPDIDRPAMVVQQQEWVEKLRHAKYENILKNNPGITLLRGMARFQDANTLLVTCSDGYEQVLRADRILLAVGASAAVPDIAGLVDTPFWTSTEALLAGTIPSHLIVLGGSVIALELAQAFRYLGSEVSILARSTLLSKEDPVIGAGLQQVFADEGISVVLNSVTDTVNHNGQQFMLATNNGEFCADQLLVATGRQANTAALALDKVGVEIDAQGSIVIDDHMRTNVKNIYAAGDCTHQPQFVYVAAAGTCAARNMTGDNETLDLSIMPTVIFTHPQVGTVGLNVQQAIAQGLVVESRTLSLENVPRALVNMNKPELKN
ncbi:Mercuric ion reductase, partial [hydrothermal vent metagenome]